MKALFIELIVQPFYNALIFIMDFVTPDLGLAIIILTIIFRLVLFPLYKSQITTQIKMQQLQQPMKDLREKHKGDQKVLGEKMMELYKEYNLNPLSGFLIILIQIPLLIGFYWVFIRAGLPEINMDLIYSFMPRPENINTNFLGLIELTDKSIILAMLVSITQYVQTKILLSKTKLAKEKAEKDALENGKEKEKASKEADGKENIMEEAMKNVQSQMLFIMPIMMLFIGYSFGAIVAIYLLVGNLFSIAQELYIRKTAS
jgi:YidC/Oxa1 family membrane protein insertase